MDAASPSIVECLFHSHKSVILMGVCKNLRHTFLDQIIRELPMPTATAAFIGKRFSEQAITHNPASASVSEAMDAVDLARKHMATRLSDLDVQEEASTIRSPKYP